MPILAMGIVEEVRVCDPCFEQSGASASASAGAKRVRVEEIAAPEPVKPESTVTTAVKDEDEDLKKAIEASLQDQLKTALNGAPAQASALVSQPVSVSVVPEPVPVQLEQVPLQLQPQSLQSQPAQSMQPPPVQPAQPAQSIQLQQVPAPNVRDLIMPVEVETVGLFVQLISKLTSAPSRLPQDQPAIAHLAAEMRSLQRRLQLSPAHSALNADLSVALNRLDLLHSQAPSIHRPPSISALSSGSSELERMRGSVMGGLKSPNEPLRQQMRRLSIEAIEGPSRPESFGAVGVGVEVPVTPLGPIETTAPIVIPGASKKSEMGHMDGKDEKKSKDKEKKKSKKKKSDKKSKKKDSDKKVKDKKSIKKKDSDKNGKKKDSDKKSDSKQSAKDKKHKHDPKNEKDPLIKEKPEKKKKKKEKASKSDETETFSKKSKEPAAPAEGSKAKETSDPVVKSSKRRRSERIRIKSDPKKEVTNLIDL